MVRPLPERSITEPYRPAIIAGRYRITEVVQKGASSVVCFGHDVREERPVALKHVINPSRTAMARYLALRAQGPKSVPMPPLLELVESKKDLWLVWGRAFGASLDQHWGDLAFVPSSSFEERWAHLAPILAALVEALDALHALHIGHLDLKPRNIRVDAAGLATLVDFGAGDGGALENEGDVGFSAPEVAEGLFVGRLADQWSLGAVLYLCLTGHHPFAERTAEARRRAAERAECPAMRQWRPDIPLAFDDAVSRMLRRDPEQRFATVRAAGEALGMASTLRPPRLREPWTLPARPFCGRDALLTFARRRAAELLAGQGGVATLIADAGMGKTAFLGQVAAAARAEGVVHVHCASAAPGAPRQVLRHWFEDPGAQGGTQPVGVVDRVLASIRGPTLLMLDGIEATDALCWARIERVARAAVLGQAAAPLFVVLSGRSLPDFSEEMPAQHARRFDVALTLLERKDIATALRCSPEDTAGARFLETCWDESQGQPESLFRSLLGLWREGRVRWGIESFVPDKTHAPATDRPAGGPAVSSLLGWIDALGAFVEVELLLSCVPGARSVAAEALAFAAAHDLVRLRLIQDRWYATCRFSVPHEDQPCRREVFARAAQWAEHHGRGGLGGERIATWWRAAGDHAAAGRAYLDAAAAHHRVGASGEARRLASLAREVAARSM